MRGLATDRSDSYNCAMNDPGTRAAQPASPNAGRTPGLEGSLGFRLGRAHRHLRSAWEHRIADLDLTGAQAAILRSVADGPGTGLRELARHLQADPMNVKRTADELERAGLLHSDSDPADRRRRILTVTARGRAVADDVADRSAAWTAHLSELLDPADAGTLLELLGRLEAGLARGDEQHA